MIDIHSHILPSIDDGARSFEESIEIIHELSSYGITDIIATPHFIKETYFTSSVAKNKALLKELKIQLKTHGIKTNIYLGNEIYVDEDISKLIKSKQITSLNNSKYLLIELPLNEEFPNYSDHFLSLMNQGYKVILAHPERYAITQKDYTILEDLHEIGVLFQCNLGSAYGKYGKPAQKLLKKLAKDNRIFAFGSDAHHPGSARHFNTTFKKLSKYYNKDDLQKVLVNNPRKLLHPNHT